jgi:hypothetical protein
MSDTEGTAAARPEDYVREFMQQLAHPETHLKTDTRPHADTVYSGTSWGHAGRDAILAALKRGRECEAALRALTTNRVHDALCLAFKAWENEHSDFDRARLVLGDIKVQVSPGDVAAGPVPDAAFDEFQRVLDNPPKANEALRNLMQKG